MALAAPLAMLMACETFNEAGDQIDEELNDPAADAGAQVERDVIERDLEYPTYDSDTILDEAENFFGQASAEVAELIASAFSDQGRPQAYIAGEEAGGAIGVGVTYGKGILYRPNAAPVEVYWQGPSIGFDVGADASKVFTLVYDLGATENLYQRIPGGEGNAYLVGGAAAEVLTTGDLTVVPIRTGVGARAGVNVGYMHFSDDRKWIPF
jgi:hypothetical protein